MGKLTDDKKAKTRILQWVRRHPNVKTVYLNPDDVPSEWKRTSGLGFARSLHVEGCLILESAEIPCGCYWPVPGRYGRDLALCYRQMAHINAMMEVLSVAYEKMPA